MRKTRDLFGNTLTSSVQDLIHSFILPSFKDRYLVDVDIPILYASPRRTRY